MVRPQGLRLAALCPLLVATAWISRSFVGPVVPSRSPSTLRHFKNAPEAEPEQPKDALEDVWRYIGGWYEVKKIDGKLYFRENNLQGELVAQDDWLVAELPPSGTIRLKLGPSGQEVLSNFKPADTDTWGDTITALREWESLTARTDSLKSTLSESTFEGSVDGVTVTVDGRQRTVDLKISDAAASKGSKLGTLIKEAHSDAVDRSLEAMTENLQELYASHFSAKK